MRTIYSYMAGKNAPADLSPGMFSDMIQTVDKALS